MLGFTVIPYEAGVLCNKTIPILPEYCIIPLDPHFLPKFEQLWRKTKTTVALNLTEVYKVLLLNLAYEWQLNCIDTYIVY